MTSQGVSSQGVSSQTLGDQPRGRGRGVLRLGGGWVPGGHRPAPLCLLRQQDWGHQDPTSVRADAG